MSFRYEIKSGAEHRIFAEDGVRNLGNGIIESDYELSSPYVTLLDDQPAAPSAPAPPSVAPVQPPALAPSAVPIVPASSSPSATQQIDKEASN